MQTVASAGRPVEEAFQSRQGRQQLKEKPPDSQGKESMQIVASGRGPVEKVIQSRQGRQQLKEEPPDRQGNTTIEATASGGQTSRGRHPQQAGKAETEGKAT